MNQSELHRSVSRATGESVRTIRRLGFSLCESGDARFDPPPADSLPQIVDWDQLELDRMALAVQA